MRIAIYQELYPPSTGGQEIRASGLARALVETGHQVSVFCIGDPGNLPTREIVDGVSVHRYPEAPGYRRTRVAWRQPSVVLRFSWWARRRAAQDGNQIHFYMQWPMLHTLIRPGVVADTAIVDWCEINAHPALRLMQRILPRRGATNTAVSEQVARSITNVSGRPTQVLPTGVDIDQARREHERDRQEILLLYLGRIFAHKNIPLAIQAFARLRSRHPRIRMRIAGFGPAEESVRTEISRLPPDIRSDVQMLGQISEQEKWSLMQEASVLVLPSEREGFPVSVVEAMAIGLPVATVDRPENGTRFVVQSYRNGVVTEATATDLAAGVETVLGDWEQYSQRALAAAQKFDWRDVAKQFIQIAQELLDRSQVARP